MAKVFTSTLTVSLFLAFVVGKEVGDNLLKLKPTGTITQTPEGYQSDLGVINGARPCGGPAQVLDWRFESCMGEATCQIPSDGRRRRCEFVFVPTDSFPEGLGIRVNVTAPGVSARGHEFEVESGPITGGIKYTAMTAGSPTKEFQGKTMTLQYIIFRKVDNFVETCLEAEFQNV